MHIRAGVTGKMRGYLDGTVTSATFNPNGCAVASTCTTTQGFLLAVFGPAGPATYTCNVGYANCKFKFEYHADHGQALIFDHWTDKSTNPPGGEIFKGDIADA